jgi:hypothetical protein
MLLTTPRKNSCLPASCWNYTVFRPTVYVIRHA